jgi:hypothetical protein
LQVACGHLDWVGLDEKGECHDTRGRVVCVPRRGSGWGGDGGGGGLGVRVPSTPKPQTPLLWDWTVSWAACRKSMGSSLAKLE